MKPFERLSSKAIVVPEENIDTDVIFPARFLLIMEKQGLGRYLFHDRRFTTSGNKRPGSPFDRADSAGATILIAGANFGCGSSREHAVWALAGFGIGCVIAPGFGEIFHANCFNSGILPIVLPPAIVTHLARQAEAGIVFDVDLETCEIITSDGTASPFTMDPSRREALLRGWNATDLILGKELRAIERFERAQERIQPWLFE